MKYVTNTLKPDTGDHAFFVGTAQVLIRAREPILGYQPSTPLLNETYKEFTQPISRLHGKRGLTM